MEMGLLNKVLTADELMPHVCTYAGCWWKKIRLVASA